MAALACIAASWSPIRRALAQGRRDALVETLESIEHPFWASRYNLQASPLARPHALIGGERIRDILINIFHPIAVALEESAWADFLRERAPTPAVTMRAAAQKFFGGIDRKLLASAAIQQGLLQLDRDHRISQEPAAFLDALRGAA